MAKFEIKFKHTVEHSYTATVDADSEEEAEKLFDDDPFNFVKGDYEDEQGLEIEIESTTEIDEDV